jgi:hypothetical protein
MLAILLESALFIALVALLGALFFAVVRDFTPLGTYLRQVANRRQIERALDQDCPTHGHHDERELVRLPGGATMCPECYQETMNGKLL